MTLRITKVPFAIAVMFLCTTQGTTSARAQKGPPAAQRPANSVVIPPFISGYVLVPDGSQHTAEGVEVRLMVCKGHCPDDHIGSGTEGVLPTGVSVVTNADGQFEFNESRLALLNLRTFDKLYLNIKLDGYSELTEEVHFTPPYLYSSGNVLMLNRGSSDGLDLTHWERLPLTRVEALREELVTNYNELAVRQYEQGLHDSLNNKIDSAISNFQKAVKSAPTFFAAWMELGTAEKAAKRRDEAKQAFQSAAKIAPNAGEPLIELGATLLDEAETLESAKHSPEASQTYADAAAQIKTGLAKAPWSGDGHYYLGSALYKLNRFPESESELQSAISAVEPRQDARLMLVNLYIKEKRYADALTQLNAYADAVPHSFQRDAVDQMRSEIANALQQPVPGPQPADQPPLAKDRALDAVIQRAVQYVGKYEETLGNLIGTEDYDQVAVWNGAQAQKLPGTFGAQRVGVADSLPARRMEQRTLSDFLLIKVGSEWIPLREVNLMNGKKIQNNPDNFSFGDSPADNTRRFNSMRADSTKYNIGDVDREMVNLPTFALEVLRKAEATRFDFQRSGSDKIGGVATWKVKFREKEGHALVTTSNGQNIYSTGVLWIDPDTGEVLKTEFDLDNRSGRPEIISKDVVTYASQHELNILVPAVMLEHYEAGGNVIDCKASYSNFRPFTVNVQFEMAPPHKP